MHVKASQYTCFHLLATLSPQSFVVVDTSIIINGAEKSLAAGGGLRALRHLKNLKK